jgi:hypothetical protein
MASSSRLGSLLELMRRFRATGLRSSRISYLEGCSSSSERVEDS